MNPPELTDHAILRFLERVQGIDIDALREQIINSLPILKKRGFRLVIENNKLITIMKPYQKHRKRRQKRKKL